MAGKGAGQAAVSDPGRVASRRVGRPRFQQHLAPGLLAEPGGEHGSGRTDDIMVVARRDRLQILTVHGGGDYGRRPPATAGCSVLDCQGHALGEPGWVDQGAVPH